MFALLEPLSDEVDRPIARETALTPSVASTFTSPPVAVTLMFGSIVAVLVASTQLTLIAAATPTPPPPPECDEELLFAVLVWLLALGRVGALLEFGLPWTWLLAWLSAPPP